VAELEFKISLRIPTRGRWFDEIDFDIFRRADERFLDQWHRADVELFGHDDLGDARRRRFAIAARSRAADSAADAPLEGIELDVAFKSRRGDITLNALVLHVDRIARRRTRQRGGDDRCDLLRIDKLRLRREQIAAGARGVAEQPALFELFEIGGT